jgi:O-6-methylguanine DNA methyltransferase
MHAYLDRIDSPVGPIAIAANGAGALLGLTFLEGPSTLALEQELERDGYHLCDPGGHTAQARRELCEYFAGTRTSFDVPLVLRGSAFQQRVWSELCRIPFGEVRSYGRIAKAIGRPTAARAVGRANATNRIPIIIPCHRVIGADGSLTGFGGGLGLKARLLSLEAAQGVSGPLFLPLPTSMGLGPGAGAGRGAGDRGPRAL